MARSKYPSELDTSKELPAVRDNILEIGSEVINSLRSAVFNIERTLGVNPQGASGNTVANRLNTALDGNGQIRKEALTLANVLSGPIVDADVAKTASISESKLRLTFPTQVLQDQISMVNGEIDNIIDQVETLSSTLATHLHASAVNRHSSAAISVTPTTSTASDEALTDIEADNVQSAFEDIHNRHINYSGEDITEANNSHTASQVYFDDSEIDGLIVADDVQEAIEKTVLLTSGETIEHQDFHHSNGYLRNGFITDPANSELGLLLAEEVSGSFSSATGESDGLTRVVFDEAITLGGFVLQKGDWLIIEDEADTNGLYTGTFEIAVINLSTDETQVESVEVYGLLRGSDTSTTLLTVSKNPRRSQSVSGLLLAAREKATLTSSDALQLANPDAVAIVSSGIKPSEITSTNRFVALSVDGGTAVTLDLYDTASSRQTVESVIKRINEQAVESNYDFLAYRVLLADGGVEFAIVHNLPDTSSSQHTLSVSASSDDGLTAAGLSHLEDLEVSAAVGSRYHINGEPFVGLREKLNTTGLSYFAGSSSITIGSTSIDFLESDIKDGDVLVIVDAGTDSDNGSYIVSDVLSESITISSDQLPSGFAGDVGEDTSFIILDSIFNLESIVFDEVSSSFGAAMIECFIDSNQKLFWNKRLEYEAVLSGSDPLFVITDYSNDLKAGDTLSLDIFIENGVTYASVDDGEARRVVGTDYYIWLNSGETNKRLLLHIPSATALGSYITANGNISTTIYGFDPVNEESVLLVGRIPYGSFKGRALGGLGTDNPKTFVPVYEGTISWDDLRTDVVENAVERPANELRSGGVVRGLEVSSASIASSLYSIVVESGVCYVGGKRFQLESKTIETDISSATVDKFYVAVDLEGQIVFAPAESGSCENPFAGTDYVVLASVEYDSVTVRVVDSRLFISDIDLKILNAISVSPNSKMGHFSDTTKAIRYAKRFSDIYPDAGTPTIHLKSGTHSVTVEIDRTDVTALGWVAELGSDPESVFTEFHDAVYEQGIILDFPVNIVGEGDSTILSVRTEYTFSDLTLVLRGLILIPGDGFSWITAPVDAFTSGFIRFHNFKMDNCRIQMTDCNIDDGAGTQYIFGVEADSMIFDQQNFTPSAIDGNDRAIHIDELNDNTSDKGNLRVSNCKFIDCQTDIDSVERLKNFQFHDNVIYGNSGRKFFGGSADNPLEFDSAADGSNINIRGNYNAEVFDTMTGGSPPEIHATANLGERVEADLHVAGFVKSESYSEASEFNYNTTYQLDKVVHIDQVGDPNMYDTDAAEMTFSVQTIASRDVRTITDLGSSTRIGTVRLPDIMEGQTLITIIFGIYSPSGAPGDYDYNLYSEDVSYTQTLESSGTLDASPHLGNDMYNVGVINLSIDGERDKWFYIKFNRSTPGSTQYITHVKYILEVDDVQAIGGLVT
nr:hypothetical protein 89 [bacterium]